MLEISFSLTPGMLSFVCDDKLSSHLRKFASQFTTPQYQSTTSVDVETEELLENLEGLGAWPDSDVLWDPGVLSLLESNLSDAQKIDELLRSRSRTEASPEEISHLEGELTNFQSRDVGELAQLNHGANFSVPGAGKTRSTLALFMARKHTNPNLRMLVVSPKSAFESWSEEASTVFSDRITVEHLSDGGSGDIILINYERLASSLADLVRLLSSGPFMLVLDEAHRIKLGPAGVWGSACMQMAPYALHRLILTGTPAPNGPQDLENLFSFVWPGQGRQLVRRAVSNGDLVQASRALAPLFVRTTKSELSLPAVNLKTRRLPLEPIHHEIYQALLGQGRSIGNEQSRDIERIGRIFMYLLMAATSPSLVVMGADRYEPLQFRVPPLTLTGSESLGELMKDLSQYEMSSKYREVIAIVGRNALLGRKTIVWSTFVRNLRTLERLLENFGPVLIHGGTEDRDDRIRRFRHDPDAMVLLSNPATLGEGISLHTVCHDAVYVDRDFSAGRYLQSLDRIHRLGLDPETETNITCLISENTIDEIVDARLASKVRFLGAVLDDPDVTSLADLEIESATGAAMTYEDIAAVLNHISTNAE